MAWTVEHHRGPAGEFHGRAIPSPAERALWWFEVDRPALVLGSTQRDDTVDADAAAADGVEVVRRRSGGGAVLLEPWDALWLDVILPAGDPLWDDDVSRASHWLGRVWAAALVDVGFRAEVHVGPLVTTPWSRLVCFAGLGPGEVTIGGRKAVGISQRRTRDAARFQCSLARRWAPATMARLLALDPADRRRLVSDLADAVAPVPLDAGRLRAAVEDHLPT
jgi:lipoate-protein ligase A